MTDTLAPTARTADDPTKAFSISIVVSAVRCLLTYVVFPWLLPLLHLADGVGPGLGLVFSAIGIVSNVFSIRRFWRADHRWKWPISVLNASVIVLLSVLLVVDLADLL